MPNRSVVASQPAGLIAAASCTLGSVPDLRIDNNLASLRMGMSGSASFQRRILSFTGAA